MHARALTAKPLSDVDACRQIATEILSALQTPLGEARAGRARVQLASTLTHLTGVVPTVVKDLQPLHTARAVPPNAGQETLLKLKRRQRRPRTTDPMPLNHEQLLALRHSLVSAVDFRQQPTPVAMSLEDDSFVHESVSA